MPVLTNLLVILLTLGTIFSDNKRLLLNDPDVLNARLVHLEQVLVQLNLSLQHETTLRQAQDTEIAALRQKVLPQETEITALRQKVSSQETEITALNQKLLDLGKEVQQQLTGFVAGQEYYHKDYNSRFGGPANALCLPQDPELSNVSFTVTWSTIFGSEYQVENFAPGYADRDVPCSVCRVVNKTSAIMIPGRRTCYQGWTEEYHGILASGSREQTASMYICMDGNPEYILHGEANENGHLFYPVKYQCGSLPCPPYRGDRMAECVVCSK